MRAVFGSFAEFGTHAFEVCQRFMETVCLDGWRIIDITLPTKMPLSEMTRDISVLLEETGQRGSLGIEPIRDATALIVTPIVQVRGNPPSLRILPGHQCTA